MECIQRKITDHSLNRLSNWWVEYTNLSNSYGILCCASRYVVHGKLCDHVLKSNREIEPHWTSWYQRIKYQSMQFTAIKRVIACRWHESSHADDTSHHMQMARVITWHDDDDRCQTKFVHIYTQLCLDSKPESDSISCLIQIVKHSNTINSIMLLMYDFLNALKK